MITVLYSLTVLWLGVYAFQSLLLTVLYLRHRREVTPTVERWRREADDGRDHLAPQARSRWCAPREMRQAAPCLLVPRPQDDTTASVAALPARDPPGKAAEDSYSRPVDVPRRK